jgi:hypothetical protein
MLNKSYFLLDLFIAIRNVYSSNSLMKFNENNLFHSFNEFKYYFKTLFLLPISDENIEALANGSEVPLRTKVVRRHLIR